MNDLDLPPRRTLPSEVRERIRGTVDAGATGNAAPRSHARIAIAGVAAGVAVLAVGAVVITQSVAGTPDDFRPGAQPPPSTASATAMAPVAPGLVVRPPDTLSHEDLDKCGAVADASPRAHEFAPRKDWHPEYTATGADGARVTAYREYGGKPAFCEIAGGTATVSDPSIDTMNFDFGAATPHMSGFYGLYLTSSGILAGVAQNVSALEFTVVQPDLAMRPVAPPILQDELFVVNLGPLEPGSFIEVVARDKDGLSKGSGTFEYDPATVRPVGASGPG